jgi:Ca2+-binding RTX toxin-like protein
MRKLLGASGAVALVVAGGLATQSGAAGGSQAFAAVGGPTLYVTAVDDSDTRIKVRYSQSPAGYIVTEGTSYGPTSQTGCSDRVGHPEQDFCADTGIGYIVVFAGDMSDRVELDADGSNAVPKGIVSSLYGGDDVGSPDGRDVLLGGRSRDSLIGDTGRDKLLGRGGKDELDAKDGVRDLVIDCGGGNDTHARRDHKDPDPVSC